MPFRMGPRARLAAAAAAVLILSALLLHRAGPRPDANAGNAWHPADRPALSLREWKTRDGGGDAWAATAPSHGDTRWDSLAGRPDFWVLHGHPPQGTRWYRTTVRLEGPVDSLDPLFLRVFALPRAQEFFWDGVRIGGNGRTAESFAEEVPGALMATVRIPPRLTAPGEHVLAVRASNHGKLSGGLGEAYLGTLRALQQSTHVDNAIVVFLAGVFVITAVFQFVNFLSSIRGGYVLFSIFCLGSALHLLPDPLGVYLGMDVDDLRPVLLAGILGWGVMMTALPLFYIGEFTGLARRWHLPVLAVSGGLSLALAFTVLGVVPPGWIRFLFPANNALGALAVIVSIAATAWGVYRNRPGAAHATLGLLLLLAGVAGSHLLSSQYPWGLGLAALILFQNASLSRQWQSRNLEQQETQLRASRLEIELLKKNIQPHFLLHSLRSITDLLLKEPRTAARLVNALAEELRMMLKMTHEKVISLAEEIRLCRSHLEVIGLRGGRRLALEEEFAAGSAEGLAIPPMVLHTLLEQGLEEADENHPEIRFRLAADAGTTLRLRLSHGAPSRARSPFPRDETGLRYVRARLEEAYPGRWSLEAGTPVAGATWQMEIEIRHPERLS